jgi:citrate lyase beta subunit
MLAASLYVPATHKDLQPIANGELLGEVRSLIFCTEDAVADEQLSFALGNLSLALQQITSRPGNDVFVRVRSPDVMRLVLKMPGSENLSGFVLPKATRHNFGDYFCQIRKTRHMLMPTLETADVFDETEMKLFRQCIAQEDVRERILALRIGGNDLLALLGIRRSRGVTIYRTPLGAIISNLVATFLPYGFRLTAPVFEYLDNPALLAQELQEDLAHGLMCKAAIHPDQIVLIEDAYRVHQSDLEMAVRLINPDSPAIFKMNGSMCEPATHRPWANAVVERAGLFGIHKPDAHKMTTRFAPPPNGTELVL